jgi:hypothetical protein
MPRTLEDLQHIAARALAHHEQHAQSNREGTRDLRTPALSHGLNGNLDADSDNGHDFPFRVS